MMAQEDRLATDATDGIANLSPQALREVLQNLRVHQIELEMQNNELRRTQAALEMQNDELRRTQAALVTAQSHYFDLYDQAPVGYVTVSDKALILHANLCTAALLGLPRARLIGKALPGFMLTADADRYYLLCRQVLASGRAQSCELPMHRPDGLAIWVNLTAIAATGDDGTAVIRMVLSDITHRRQLEQAAKEASEDKFRLVADITSDGIVIFGADKRIAYASPSYFRQLGISEAEVLNCSLEMIYAMIHPQDRDALIARIERAIESKESDLLLSYRIQHRLGHYIWRETSAKLQYDGSGNFLQACVVARDITQRRQAEEEMRIAAVAFETQDAILITDANSVIVRANQAFTRTTGYTAEEVLGQTPHFLRSGLHDQEFYRQAWDTVRSTGRWQGEVWDRHKDGSVWPKLLTITAIKGIDGVVSHYVGSYFDLSERKRTEANMLEMNRNLTQSRQQLRQLVALNETMLEQEKRHIAREVHDELGQVLTALRMDLSLVIIRHASRMPGLLDELNGMKIQVDRAILGVRNVATSLRPAALDLGLVPAIAWLCEEFARHGGVMCQFIAPDQSIVCDASRAVVVFRIVQESLNNISKYARASQVTVSLALSGNELALQVQDNGIGFDLAAVAKRGTLGLLGMRERVIALDGRVEVSSIPGQGTLIDLLIPLAPDVAKDAP